jgi:YVTN family beta-propeller protein
LLDPPPANHSGESVERLDAAIGTTLATLLDRRTLLGAAAGGFGALLLAACRAAPAATPTSAPTSAAPTAASTAAATATGAPSAATAAPAASSLPAATSVPAAASGAPPWVYVFNVGSQDVTVIDSATNKVLATRPLGAAVRWLSDEQRYWDGSRVWTYDFPGNKLRAIAIDPKAVQVVRTIETGSTGPGHSLMLTPDHQTALVNAAGSDVIDVLDLKAGTVADKITTGKFP